MKFLMAANWKMYKTCTEARDMLTELTQALGTMPEDREAVVFAPATALCCCAEALRHSPVRLGGQNCYPAVEGAFTGEIAPRMLQACGCSLVLTGHSERRAVFHESDSFVGEKTFFALQAGLDVVLCVGETLEERDAGQLTSVLQRQITQGTASVDRSFLAHRLSVAYEPVWAIGTGRVAGESEIVEAHTFIRGLLCRLFPEQGKEMRILYGGSVKPENAKTIIGLDNVNGVLVGGASLQAKSFSNIVLA